MALTRRDAMNVDDETVLSAYLDGELDADQRARVDAALLAYPALADQLRELAAVRDLVVHLPRVAPERDLSDSVVAAIARSRLEGSVALRQRRLERLRAIGEFAIAAAVLLSLTLGLRSVLRNVPPRPDHPALAAGGPDVAGTSNARRVAEAAGGGRAGSEVRSATTVADSTASSGAPVVASAPAAIVNGNETDRELARTRIRSLLDNPNLELYVVDLVGGHAIDGVEDIIKGLPRRDPSYGRISVPEGIALDPVHPGEATVFAIPVDDDRERREVLARLKASFPDTFARSQASPIVVTQLADLDDASIRAGIRSNSADLVPPPGDLARAVTAIRSVPKEKTVIRAPVPDEFPGMNVQEVREDGPTPEQMRSMPHPSIRNLKDKSDAAVAEAPAAPAPPADAPRPAAAHRPSIVLVWVAGR
jgi:anti-sigma factor RsiW